MASTPLPILSSRGVWEFDVSMLDEANAPVLSSVYDDYIIEFRTGPNADLIGSCSTGNGRITVDNPVTNTIHIALHTAQRSASFQPTTRVPVVGDLIGFIGSDDYPLGRIEFICDPTVTKGPRDG